ncbi:MAG: heme exporter protein CcmB [Bacteroidota bacterium]
MSRFLSATWAIFQNDARLELRTRTALGALGMFVAAALMLVRFALGRASVSPTVAAAVLWIVVVFAGAVGLGRAFVAEEERGTTLLLRLAAPPEAVYAGKLLFNVVLTLALALVAGLGMRVLVPSPIGVPSLYWSALALGALGLASTTTLLSALLARAQAAGPLLPVLAFPLLIPLLSSGVALTLIAAGSPEGAWEAAQTHLIGLGAYAGLTSTVSFLLFDYVWKD